MERKQTTYIPSYGSIDEYTPDKSSIGNLTEESVVMNIRTIITNCQYLSELTKLISTEKDNAQLRTRIHSLLMTAKATVDRTMRELDKISVSINKQNKRDKLRIDKLTNQFKETITKFSITQKEAIVKLKYSLPEKQFTNAGNTFDQTQSTGQDSVANVEEWNIQKQLELEREEYVIREDALKQIESDIMDINETMKELGTMVYSHGETIDSIDNAVEVVGANVTSGIRELDQAVAYKKSHRKKLCVLFAALLVCAVIVGYVIYSSFS